MHPANLEVENLAFIARFTYQGCLTSRFIYQDTQRTGEIRVHKWCTNGISPIQMARKGDQIDNSVLVTKRFQPQYYNIGKECIPCQCHMALSNNILL